MLWKIFNERKIWDKRTVHKREVYYRADACKYLFLIGNWAFYQKFDTYCIVQQLIKFFTSNWRFVRHRNSSYYEATFSFWLRWYSPTNTFQYRDYAKVTKNARLRGLRKDNHENPWYTRGDRHPGNLFGVNGGMKRQIIEYMWLNERRNNTFFERTSCSHFELIRGVTVAITAFA